MQNFEIQADINPQFLEHFKSQLLQLEVNKSDIKILFNGGGFQDRHELILKLANRSFQDIPSSKTIRFWIFTGDNRPAQSVNGEPLFSISGQRNTQDFIIPDPYVISWNSIGVHDFLQYCDKLKLDSLSQRPTIPKAIWRGSVSQHASRKNMLECLRNRKSEFIDFENVDSNLDINKFIPMDGLKNWGCLLDFPGQGYSARLKYLMQIIRPKVVIERLDWDFATVNLEPGFHYASAPDDFNVIDYTINNVIKNYEWWLQKSLYAAEEMIKITERTNVSQNFVKKILKYV